MCAWPRGGYEALLKCVCDVRYQPSFHGVDLCCLREAAVNEYFKQPVVVRIVSCDPRQPVQLVGRSMTYLLTLCHQSHTACYVTTRMTLPQCSANVAVDFIFYRQFSCDVMSFPIGLHR